MNKKIALFAFLVVLLASSITSQQDPTEGEIYIITIDYHEGNVKILNIELSSGYSPQFDSEDWSACIINKNSEKACTAFKNPSRLLTDGKDAQENMLGSEETIKETVFRIITPRFKDAETITIMHKTPEKTEQVESIDVKDIQFSPAQPLYSIRKKLSFFSLSSFILSSLIISLFYMTRIKNKK